MSPNHNGKQLHLYTKALQGLTPGAGVSPELSCIRGCLAASDAVSHPLEDGSFSPLRQPEDVSTCPMETNSEWEPLPTAEERSSQPLSAVRKLWHWLVLLGPWAFF